MHSRVYGGVAGAGYELALQVAAIDPQRTRAAAAWAAVISCGYCGPEGSLWLLLHGRRQCGINVRHRGHGCETRVTSAHRLRGLLRERTWRMRQAAIKGVAAARAVSAGAASHSQLDTSHGLRV